MDAASDRSPDDPMARLAALDGVGAAVAAAGAGLDAVVRDRGVRRFDDRRRAVLAEVAARADAELLGRTDDESVLAAGLRVTAELPALASDVLRTPAQVIARIHTVWARGTVPDAALGRVADPVAAARLADLANALTAPTRAPGLVVAAIAHAEVVTIAPFGASFGASFGAPFGDASGAVARWLERAVLTATGTDATGLAPLQAGHAARPDYGAALDAYRTGTVAGLRTWLLYAAAALGDAAEVMSTVR